MKIYVKVFLSMLVLISVSFGVFGTLMIQASFQSALEREIEMGKTENRMLKITYETAVNSLSHYYYDNRENMLKYAVESLQDRVGKQETALQFFDSGGNILFSNSREKLDEVLFRQISENESGYRIFATDAGYFLNVMSMVNLRIDGEPVWLETTTDISHLYRERENLLRTYRVLMLIVLCGAGVVALLISRVLTGSIRELSGITRKFAKGDMGVRAQVKGKDEVSILAEDFNDMADKLADRMLSLEEQARRQEEFTSAFAHELKTPLTSIIGYADMIRSMELSEEERIKAAGYVYSQGKRLEALSLKLLELIVLKKQDFEFVKMDAEFFIQMVFDLAEVGVLERNLVLKRKAEPGKICGEKDLLISLFANLIDNSKKASVKGGTIWIEGKAVEDGYAISVRDEGTGIPEEELSKITDAFYMVDKSRSRKEGGAGLGMTLCSQIVRLHHAKWDIESQVSVGTTVTVTLGEEVPE
ncbi:MAG: HAMP domain-containing histidine kinase [Bacteroidales bacterium]|nr:HAMP domain-containing histidine kinase [Clostridium sp.]MCM1204452.1 HAMP domain-containing histidine kinase [Bacteroidales bacterium]